MSLVKQMFTHDVGRGRGGKKAAMAEVKQPVLIVGMDSDFLFPVSEQFGVETG